MVGIGEKPGEVRDLLIDLIARTSAHDGPRDPADGARGDPVDIITIGQYLQPTRNHLPIDRWVHPDEFAEYERWGLAAGFKVVMSGPLVRSSYLADAQADALTGIEAERAAHRVGTAEAGRTGAAEADAGALKLRRAAELVTLARARRG
jgi:lipoic acid synthetase